jgi:hypothetical protein
MAAIFTLGEERTQSLAAPVPRPPLPISPTRIWSDADAKRPPEVGIRVAKETAEVVLIKSLRDILFFVFLFSIKNSLLN